MKKGNRKDEERRRTVHESTEQESYKKYKRISSVETYTRGKVRGKDIA